MAERERRERERERERLFLCLHADAKGGDPFCGNGIVEVETAFVENVKAAIIVIGEAESLSRARQHHARNPNLPFVSRRLFTKSQLTEEEEYQLSSKSYENVLNLKAKAIEDLLRPFYEKDDDDTIQI